MKDRAVTSGKFQCGVSIIVKAFNEAQHIASCLGSALDALGPVGGEVILADSGSTDATVVIASRFPVTIVQLADTSQRCCGIGPQLGYQEAKGEFLFLMDGDMELKPGFLEAALARMAADPGLAGVSGLLEEEGSLNAEYRIRRLMKADDRKAGLVSHLSGGGVYRSAAVRSVGYFSNRNLHAFEELELGARLTGAGWRLERLPMISIRHHPHQKGSFTLLYYRWRSRHFYAPGELFRSALGKPHLRTVLPRFKFIAFVALWWSLTALAFLSPVSPALAGAILAAPFLAMSIRRKGLGNGSYLICSWICGFLGACLGMLRPQVDPAAPIEARILRVGPWRHGRTPASGQGAPLLKRSEA